jgi:hypothetical protein
MKAIAARAVRAPPFKVQGINPFRLLKITNRFLGRLDSPVGSDRSKDMVSSEFVAVLLIRK